VNDNTSEITVLRRLRADPEAAALLYRRHSAAVYRYLARRAGPAVAEDLLADVFVTAIEAGERARPHVSGSALPWLYGIAGNLLRRHFTAARRRKAETSAAADAVTTLDWDAVDARLDAAARRQDLAAVLGELTDGERELLLLVAWEGLSPAEAAEALDLTPSVVRSRLYRARNRAQSALNALTRPVLMRGTPR
jgi:RNA polymerase sigma factor (sigma-70 family)